jgi:hypothetical protein
MARARSRKRRPAGARRSPGAGGGAAREAATRGEAAAPDVATAPRAAATKRAREQRGARGAPAKARAPRRSPAAPTYGERPPAPWHPLPLSEVLILVGAIGAAIGLHKLAGKEPAAGKPALLAGIGAVAIGTIEVTLREHRSGYRSHTVMLALAVVLVFDSALVLALSALTTLPRLFDVGLFAIDIALFAFLFKLLRARFLDARHARVLKEG